MKYIQWRDELEGYLRDLPEEERQKIFAYFSEMYADKRDAGMSEREITAEFGAPYDVAQRILHENSFGNDGEEPDGQTPRGAARTDRGADRRSARDDGWEYIDGKTARKGDENGAGDGRCLTALFVVLCIVFCIPLFILSVVLLGVTVGFFAAPLGILIGGFATVGGAIGALVSGSGSAAVSLIALGLGLAVSGVGLALLPVFVKIILWLWRAAKAAFFAVRRLFGGKKEVK